MSDFHVGAGGRPGISDIARKLARLVGELQEHLAGDEPASAEPIRSSHSAGTISHSATVDTKHRVQRVPLPDPRLVRRILRHRQIRARHFNSDLFADPAWDMLLDLAAARAEHRRVSVTSLAIAAAVPPTTALRWIGILIEEGLFERVEDDSDRRRAFISLTDKGANAVGHYFQELGDQASQLI